MCPPAPPDLVAVRPPSVSVVIVSYQVRDLLRACLTTIRAQRGVEVETLVVDNASSDGSADMVAREFPEVRLIRNADNVGFARASNQGLEHARSPWLALVNPDTELPPTALEAVVAAFRRYPDVGAVGLALHRPDGAAQPACHAFPDALNLLLESLGMQAALARVGFGSPSIAPIPRGGEGAVDWVAGAFMVLSRRAYEAVGGLDSSRFMFGEEMDWSWRARARGFRTLYLSTPSVLHHGGASSPGLEGPMFARSLAARVDFLRRYRRGQVAAGRLAIRLGVALRLAAWTLIAKAEGLRGPLSPRTRVQLERFRAAAAGGGE